MEADIVPQFMCWENIVQNARTIMRSTSGESFFVIASPLLPVILSPLLPVILSPSLPVILSPSLPVILSEAKNLEAIS